MALSFFSLFVCLSISLSFSLLLSLFILLCFLTQLKHSVLVYFLQVPPISSRYDLNDFKSILVLFYINTFVFMHTLFSFFFLVFYKFYRWIDETKVTQNEGVGRAANVALNASHGGATTSKHVIGPLELRDRSMLFKHSCRDEYFGRVSIL